MATENEMTSNKKKKLGYALGRVSSVKQGETQHGSLSQQDNRMRRTLDEASAQSGFDYDVIKYFQETRSGRKEKFHLRKEFQEVIRAIQERSIDFVIIESVERMGRWAKKNLEIIEAANDTGVEIWFVDSGKYDSRDKGKRVDFQIRNMLAEEGTHEIGERVSKKQREAMVNNGKDTSTSPTYGLDPHPTKVGMYIRNELELRHVVDIYQKFCDLKSFKLLVSYCEKAGYKTKERWTKEKTDRFGNRIPPRKIGGEVFDEQKLRILLTSPKLRGFNFFKDRFDQFPKLHAEGKFVRWEYAHFREHGELIASDLIARVDATLKLFERHKPKINSKYGNVYLLSGVLKDHNGNSFYGGSANGGANLYYYNNVKDSADRKTIKKDEIEAIAVNRLKQFFTESGTLEKVIRAALKNRLVGIPLMDEEIPRVRSRITDLERVIENFSVSIRRAVGGADSDLAKLCSTLVQEKEKAEVDLKTEREQLQKLLDRKDQVIRRFEGQTLESYLKLAMEKFDLKTDQQKKAMIQAVIPEIIVHADNSIELRLNPDPEARTRSSCHGGGSGNVLSIKWRERWDLNPRPSP
jgi:DNA invertase Pin-like site-specific DNA recombinase